MEYPLLDIDPFVGPFDDMQLSFDDDIGCAVYSDTSFDSLNDTIYNEEQLDIGVCDDLTLQMFEQYIEHQPLPQSEAVFDVDSIISDSQSCNDSLVSSPDSTFIAQSPLNSPDSSPNKPTIVYATRSQTKSLSSPFTLQMYKGDINDITGENKSRKKRVPSYQKQAALRSKDRYDIFKKKKREWEEKFLGKETTTKSNRRKSSTTASNKETQSEKRLEQTPPATMKIQMSEIVSAPLKPVEPPKIDAPVASIPVEPPKIDAPVASLPKPQSTSIAAVFKPRFVPIRPAGIGFLLPVNAEMLLQNPYITTIAPQQPTPAQHVHTTIDETSFDIEMAKRQSAARIAELRLEVAKAGITDLPPLTYPPSQPQPQVDNLESLVFVNTRREVAVHRTTLPKPRSEHVLSRLAEKQKKKEERKALKAKQGKEAELTCFLLRNAVRTDDKSSVVILYARNEEEAQEKLKTKFPTDNLCTCGSSVWFLTCEVRQPMSIQHALISREDESYHQKAIGVIDNWIRVFKKRRRFDFEVPNPTIFFKKHEDKKVMAYFTLQPYTHSNQDTKLLVNIMPDIAWELEEKYCTSVVRKVTRDSIIAYIGDFIEYLLTMMGEFCIVFGYLRDKGVKVI